MIGSRRDLFRQLGCVAACASFDPTIRDLAPLYGDRVSTTRSGGRKVFDILDFGAVGDGRTDNTRAVQRAFDYAKANGAAVFIPAGTFNHSGTLVGDGITVFGTGDSSLLKATRYGQEALILRGTGGAVSNIHLSGMDGARGSGVNAVGIFVDGAQQFSIENVHLDHGSDAGIFAMRAGYGHIANNLIENTKSDSIHMTAGSHDIVVEQNRVLHSGDDGIAVVSYQGNGKVSHITIRHNDVRYNNWGRGISTVGGSYVLIERNNIVGGTADRAGIYIAAESEYMTESVHKIRVTRNTLMDAGGSGSGHGAITAYNSRVDLVNDDIIVTDNDIYNPRGVGIKVVGTGEQWLAAYNNRLHADSSQRLLWNVSANAHIDTTRPSTDTNTVGAEGARPFLETTNGKARRRP
jgi:hypothetical protein